HKISCRQSQSRLTIKGMDMTTNRRRFLKLTATALAAPALARTAAAAEWPQEKVIHTIIPFSAGSSVDIIGRIGFDALSHRIGQSIIVENRGGAGVTIGALQAARAEPDGYNWLFDASNHTVAPAIYNHLTYDPANDFSGVAIFGTIPNVLLVSPDKGI